MTAVLLLDIICCCESDRVSVQVFHFNPKRLTVVSVSSTPLSAALECNLGLFDAQERKLKWALAIMALAAM